MKAKGVLLGSAVFAVCFSLFVPHTCRAQGADKFALDNSALFPASETTLLNNTALFSPLAFPASFAWMTPENALPSSSHLTTRKTYSAPVNSDRRLVDRLSDALPKFDYATGEIGFMYGRSTGKYGGTFKQGYITGEAGNDRTQVFFGASYEDGSFRVPRFGR
jgi:hypothetical protein